MNPKLTRADVKHPGLGFYLIGISYRELVEQLGEPIQSNSISIIDDRIRAEISIDDKVRVKFGAIHDDGRRLAVWDWKAGYIPLSELKEWSAWGDKTLAHELFGVDRVKE